MTILLIEFRFSYHIDSVFQNNNNNANFNVNVDPSTRLANAIERSLDTFQNSSKTENSRLMSRISMTRDWPRFKQAFFASSNLGEYSEAENAIRLYEALKNKPLDATKSLFATGHSSTEIMQALEMRFGCPKVIVSKVVNEIRALPNLDTGKMSLIEFASKLKNSVASIKAMKHIGYLHNPQ